jgi:hypothetical protein
MKSLFSIIFSSMIAIRLFNPIRKLAEIMRNSSKQEDNNIQANEIDYIGNSLNRIIKTSENLKNELSKATSILGEQFLQKILNNNDSIQIDNLDLTLKNLGIQFQHKHFCVSIIQLAFSEDFKKHYSKEEQLSIHEKMLKLLSDILQKVCPVQFVQAEHWKTIIISNEPEDIDSSLITDQFDKFVELFSYDTLYMQTSIGIGRTYLGFKGMEMSYREAKLALAQLPKLAYKSIKIYDDTYDDRGYILSYNDESKIFNYLMSSKKEKANEMINSVIEANVKKNINEENLKELYNQIYQIGRRAIKHKGTEPTIHLKGDQLNVLDNYRQMDLHLIAETLNTFLQNILQYL